MSHEADLWHAYIEGAGLIVGFIGIDNSLQTKNVGVQLTVEDTYAVRIPKNRNYGNPIKMLVRQNAHIVIHSESNEVKRLQNSIRHLDTPVDITIAHNGNPLPVGMFQMEFKVDEGNIILYPISLLLKKEMFIKWIK